MKQSLGLQLSLGLSCGICFGLGPKYVIRKRRISKNTKLVEEKIKIKELLFLAHHTRSTVAWIEDVMFFEPVMMMVCIMLMFVRNSMCMSMVRKEMSMFILILSIRIASHFAKNIR